jgi:predicted PurR-regulated permease PerM
LSRSGTTRRDGRDRPADRRRVVTIALVLGVLFLLTAFGARLLAARVSAQTNELIDTLPHGFDELRRWVEQFSVLQPLIQRSPRWREWLVSSSTFRHLAGMVSTTVGAAIDALVVERASRTSSGA